MNKKFSTLMASLLLAGGLFSTANAMNLAEAEAGRYYQIKQTGTWNSTGWTVPTDNSFGTYMWYYDEDSKRVEMVSTVPAGKEDNSYWRIDKVQNKEGYYTFTSKSGYKFSVKVGDATISEFTMGGYTQKDGVGLNPLYFDLDDKAEGNSHYVNCIDESGEFPLVGATDAARGFDATPVDPTSFSADDLNAFLGKNVGFKMTIGYLKDNDANKYTAYEGLEGNPFDGLLYAEALTKGGYMLRKGGKDGDIIVLLNDNYNKQNTDVEGTDGFKFTTMTPEAFDLQVKRDNAAKENNKDEKNEKKPVVINSYKFQISQQVGSNDLEVAIGNKLNMELIVSKFGTQTVLTTAASKKDGEATYNNSTNKTYVRLGGKNLVDMTKFAGKVYYSFINEDGEVAGANCSEKKTVITDYLRKNAQANMPEGQWVLTSVDTKTGVATFSNRESKQTFTIALNTFYTTDEAGVYEIGGELYTINTVAMADADKGYADFGNTILKHYTIGVYSPVWGGVANFVENHASANHQIGLDINDATVWKLTPNAAERKVNEITDKLDAETDSVYVINDYVLWNTTNKVFDTKQDTLKVVSYMIQNAENGEYMAYANASDKKFYTCKKSDAKAFAFKKVGDSYNMVEVVLHNGTTGSKIEGGKVYGGDSANKGLLNKVSCIYDRVENDLIRVSTGDINLYRRVKNGMDTISIYRAENASQLLFEKETFLGWANDNQFDFAPAMLADTAYVEEGAIRPQYMLVVGKPISITKGTQELCPICGKPECEHSKATYDTVEGRYLVNLKDSAIAFDAKNIHAVNPYMNTEKYYRLGFVPAKRVNKTLTITSTGKELNIGTPDYNEAKFAFKYVNEAEGTFKIETADFARTGADRGKMLENPGYLKTMNGVIVVVSDEKDADIFNMNEDEHRNPTANESINAANVVVAGVNGAIVVKGAEGKNVIVSTILGKVVANETIASDNATIAAPAGIVVVSVDGESFKVVVK